MSPWLREAAERLRAEPALRRILFALAAGGAGLGITLLGAAAPWAWADWLVYPGLGFAALFFPEGVHSGGTLAAILSFPLVYLGNVLFWMGIVFAALTLLLRRSRRSRREPRAPG